MRQIQEDHLRTGSEDFEGIIDRKPGDYGISEIKYSKVSGHEAGTTWNSVIEQSDSRIQNSSRKSAAFNRSQIE
jgi:hypothetical protein